ncbi:response regulator [Geopsychrobacter electrodiphilus]|uniref:response regulator n=1 Tax=Geopsychrobacter electrodiphilus TaxID=225196 RepID=UPI00036E03C3|nr:response regulator [Geopsychrobacter electrodiphilus]
MSLVGNLEDLGLGDILQIVNLSKKSGFLTLTCGQRQGTVSFTDGLVVQATSSLFQSSLGSLLLKHKFLKPEALELALAEQATLKQRTLGSILVSNGQIASEKIEAIIKAQVERIVYNFFGWLEGTFDFQLDESNFPSLTPLPFSDFTLENGLNPQWLVSEGRRLLAEGRLVAAETDIDLNVELAQSGGHVVQEARPHFAGESGPLFIIDDDDPTRSVLQKAFIRAGFEVEVFALISDLVNACADKCKIGRNPALLIDLIMPRLDGNGILGGLEVMEIIAEEYPTLPMILMTDHPNAEAEKKAKELGVTVVLRKPKKIEIREERGVEILKNLLFEVDRHLITRGYRPPQKTADFDIGRDLVDDFDRVDQREGPEKEGSPGLHLLKGMLQELVNPLLCGGVILLILRFASELLNRAVIFDVKGNELIGIGQFGLDETTKNADRMVRSLRLTIDSDSLFGRVLNQKCAFRGRLGQSASEIKLRNQLGGVVAPEVFVGPLVSGGKVVAVLYGDNLPELRSVGDIEAFEIFLSQAGMAMEKVLLERRDT